MDYDLGDITLSSLTGFNKGRYSEFADLDNLGSTNFTFFGSTTGYNFAFLVEGELRDVAWHNARRNASIMSKSSMML